MPQPRDIPRGDLRYSLEPALKNALRKYWPDVKDQIELFDSFWAQASANTKYNWVHGLQNSKWASEADKAKIARDPYAFSSRHVNGLREYFAKILNPANNWQPRPEFASQMVKMSLSQGTEPLRIYVDVIGAKKMAVIKHEVFGSPKLSPVAPVFTPGKPIYNTHKTDDSGSAKLSAAAPVFTPAEPQHATTKTEVTQRKASGESLHSQSSSIIVKKSIQSSLMSSASKPVSVSTQSTQASPLHNNHIHSYKNAIEAAAHESVNDYVPPHMRGLVTITEPKSLNTPEVHKASHEPVNSYVPPHMQGPVTTTKSITSDIEEPRRKPVNNYVPPHMQGLVTTTEPKSLDTPDVQEPSRKTVNSYVPPHMQGLVTATKPKSLDASKVQEPSRKSEINYVPPHMQGLVTITEPKSLNTPKGQESSCKPETNYMLPHKNGLVNTPEVKSHHTPGFHKNAQESVNSYVPPHMQGLATTPEAKSKNTLDSYRHTQEPVNDYVPPHMRGLVTTTEVANNTVCQTQGGKVEQTSTNSASRRSKTISPATSMAKAVEANFTVSLRTTPKSKEQSDAEIRYKEQMDYQAATQKHISAMAGKYGAPRKQQLPKTGPRCSSDERKQHDTKPNPRRLSDERKQQVSKTGPCRSIDGKNPYGEYTKRRAIAVPIVDHYRVDVDEQDPNAFADYLKNRPQPKGYIWHGRPEPVAAPVDSSSIAVISSKSPENFEAVSQQASTKKNIPEPVTALVDSTPIAVISSKYPEKLESVPQQASSKNNVTVSGDVLEVILTENVRRTQGEDPAKELLEWDSTWRPAPVDWDDRAAFSTATYMDEYIRKDWQPYVTPLTDYAAGRLTYDRRFWTGHRIDNDKYGDIFIEDLTFPDEMRAQNLEKQMYETAAIAAEFHTATWKKQRGDKKFLKHSQQAAWAAIQTAEIQPHQFAPAVDVYLRPVTLTDATQLKDIYNHYALNSMTTEDQEPVTGADIKKIIKAAETQKMPFIVAVQGKMPAFVRSKFDNKALLPAGETVLGFAWAQEYSRGIGVSKGRSRTTAEIQLFVRHESTRKGVGRSLLDKLTSCLAPLYSTRGGYDWLDTHPNDPIYKDAGGVNNFFQLITQIVITRQQSDDPDFAWKSEFLVNSHWCQEARLHDFSRTQKGLPDGKFLDNVIFSKKACLAGDFPFSS